VEEAQTRYHADNGRYAVVFDQDGFNDRRSSIPKAFAP
jgi:hypothetical protein